MKKQITAILVLTVTCFASAFAGTNSHENGASSRKIILNTGFSKVIADGNVDVVLFENTGDMEVRTFGNSADLASTRITENGGVLTIRNTRNRGEKVLVYVPVSQLTVIEARGNSKVSSASALHSGHITLVVKGDCRMNIQTLGTVEVVENGEVEVLVKKNITALKKEA